MEVIGLVVALVALIYMALKGVNIIIAALISTLIVLVTNQIDIATGLNDQFISGKLGAFTFMGRFFLLFVAGSIFGALMGQSGAADSIAQNLAGKLGAHRALWIITLACALLTYGGVSAFVVLFSVKDLGLQLIKRAGIPLRLMIGAVALGIGTFTLTAFPGTPSLNNILAAAALGTDLYAAPLLGFVSGALMLFLGMGYLEHQRKKAACNPESNYDDSVAHNESLPKLLPSLLPILVVLLLIALPSFLAKTIDLSSGSVLANTVVYAKSQPIFWPVLSLFAGCLSIIAMLPKARMALTTTLSTGATAAVMPILNTSMVIGFASVVSQTNSFQWFVTTMTNLEMSPYLSLVASVNVIAGITGSSSGGLQIFLATMGQSFVDMGIPSDVLHRLSAMASGGLDSLPHNGAVIAILSILGSTHKESYKEIAVVSVVIPLLVTFLCALLLMAIY